MSRDAEVQPARALPARGGDEPQASAPFDQQSGGHAGLAQQALHAAVRGGVERARSALLGGRVLRQGPSTRTSSCHGGAPSAGFAFAHREVGRECLAVVGERQLELGRDRRPGPVPA